MKKLYISMGLFLFVLLCLVPISFAECYGDFDNDGGVDGSDLATFASEYGANDCGPEPRFEDNADGTITDHLTGLIWLKNANCTVFFSGDTAGQNARTWQDALTAANSLSSGYCGLSDVSIPGEWRLPSISELQSLIDYGYYDPALPNTAGTGKWTSGDPFTNVQSDHYWSATTWVPHTQNVWFVYTENGGVAFRVKTNVSYVWPVRSGQ